MHPVQSLINNTFTAFTATRTSWPDLELHFVEGVGVVADSICSPPASFTLTWHITVPRLTSVTVAVSRLQAPFP